MKKVKKLSMLLIMLFMFLSLTAPASVPVLGTLETASAAVRLNHSRITLVKGQTKRLRLTGTAKTVKWTSSKPSVVTVNAKGTITGRKKGAAVVTAKIAKKKYTCKVKVVTNAPAPTSVPIVTSTPTPTPIVTNTPTPIQPQNYVWLSATGEKYHKIPNCGRMNPNTAKQITLEEAIQLGYSPCSKCF